MWDDMHYKWHDEDKWNVKELSSSNHQVLKQNKLLRRETRDHKMEMPQAMPSKTLMSMSSFSPIVGGQQNFTSVAVGESCCQSAII